ncbi:MAG: VanZ family protein [Nocardioides alkalitolerans]
MFRQAPVLPVVVPIAALVLLGLLLHLRRRGLLSLPRASVALALAVYVAGVVANTVFPVYLDKPTSTVPWHAGLALVPFHDYEVADALMNVGVFLPVGVLASLLLARPSWGRVLAVAALFSLVIEVTQYVTARTLGGGHIADVNDLLWNVVGGVLGWALLRLAVRAPAVARLHDRFAWR